MKMLTLVNGDRPYIGNIYNGRDQGFHAVKDLGIDDVLHK